MVSPFQIARIPLTTSIAAVRITATRRARS
jgi:hypothetical protein